MVEAWWVLEAELSICPEIEIHNLHSPVKKFKKYIKGTFSELNSLPLIWKVDIGTKLDPFKFLSFAFFAAKIQKMIHQVTFWEFTHE